MVAICLLTAILSIHWQLVQAASTSNPRYPQEYPRGVPVLQQALALRSQTSCGHLAPVASCGTTVVREDEDHTTQLSRWVQCCAAIPVILHGTREC